MSSSSISENAKVSLVIVIIGALFVNTVHSQFPDLGSWSTTFNLNRSNDSETTYNVTDPPVIRNATTPFDLANLTTSFYEVDRSNLTSSDAPPAENVHFNEFWDSSLPPPPPPPVTDNEVNVGFRVTATSGLSSTTSTTTSTTTTESSVTTLRLSSNVVTVAPAVSSSFSNTLVTTTTTTTTPPPPSRPSSIHSTIGNGITDELDTSGTLWKQILHGTNMNSEELRLCNKTLISVHLKPYSRRKVARVLKDELDKQFSEFDYRWSVIISSTSRNIMGKALHGVWLSSSINGVHYFITATYKPLDTAKPMREEDMDRIENWAAVDTLSTRNMTGFHRFNRIANRLKTDLDTRYGRAGANAWSVVIVKDRFLVKARAIEMRDDFVQFNQLGGAQFLIWRGGPDIETDSRNARYMSMDSSPDDEDTSEHVFKRFSNVRTANSFGFGRRRRR